MRRNPLIESALLTFALVLWTLSLFFWNTAKWFVYSWLHTLWIVFDIVLIVLFTYLVVAIKQKKKSVETYSLVLFGVILTDWIIGLLMFSFLHSILTLQFVGVVMCAVVSTGVFYAVLKNAHESAKTW